MPNVDKQRFGIFNRRTHILTQKDTDKTFSDIQEAKEHFFKPPALEVHEDTCAKLTWQLIEGKKLKYTMAWGISHDPNIKAGTDWADQYNNRKYKLQSQDQWANYAYETEISNDHLF